MKKIAAFILLTVFVLAFSGSALAAVGSVQAPEEHPEITADKPVVVIGDVEFKTVEELTVEEQVELEEATESLAEIVPEGMVVQNLNMVEADEHAELITLKMDKITELETQQLVDNQWVDLEVAQKDDVYTVTLTGKIPVAVSFKLDPETNRPKEQLVNGEWVNIEDLGNEDCEYTIPVSYTYPADVTVRLEDKKNVVIKQLVDGQWVDVETVDNGDGTYTVTVSGPGFLAIMSE